MADGEKSWETRSAKKIRDFGIFQATQVERLGPHGKTGQFIVLDAPDWGVAVPVLERGGRKFFLTVRQYRHGSGRASVEFPGGIIERGEDPAAAVRRELREETGYEAGKLTFLGEVSPNPAILTNRFHIYLAEDLRCAGEQCLDENELVDIEEIGEREFLERLGPAPYDHALMSAAAFLYVRHKRMLKT